ncbi:DUF4348 domain-containing protein [Flavobacterium gelatinilyticum]|uniref:DUF4348 domain-containing protein n=1 Tax=Flavobacterium gelatinilyticum TaxID=3003260 RepID=UPI002480FBEA|nr:DUF4348 domain-containing protein [Flavobacterium gelatinilyticum]
MKKIIVLVTVFLLSSPLMAQNKTAAADENFTAFLKKFTADKNFQLSRVNFPMTVKMNNDDLELADYVITKSNYNMIKLNDKGSDYKQKDDHKSKTIVINRRGTDNGIYVDYVFHKIKGQWYLKTWVDMST